jgi:hypothetical protein
MTTAASLTAGFGFDPWVESAVSNEASILSGLIRDASEFSGTLTVGEPRRIAQQALETVVAAAQVDNWDTAGAKCVEPSTYLYASQFLRLLPVTTPPPDIAADTDGEILFEWDLGPRKILTVSVSRDGTLSFASLFGHSKNYGTEPLREGLPLVVSSSLARLTA